MAPATPTGGGPTAVPAVVSILVVCAALYVMWRYSHYCLEDESKRPLRASSSRRRREQTPTTTRLIGSDEAADLEMVESWDDRGVDPGAASGRGGGAEVTPLTTTSRGELYGEAQAAAHVFLE